MTSAAQRPGVFGDQGGMLGTAYHDLGLLFHFVLSSGQPGATTLSLRVPFLCPTPIRPPRG